MLRPWNGLVEIYTRFSQFTAETINSIFRHSQANRNEHVCADFRELPEAIGSITDSVRRPAFSAVKVPVSLSLIINYLDNIPSFLMNSRACSALAVRHPKNINIFLEIGRYNGAAFPHP